MDSSGLESNVYLSRCSNIGSELASSSLSIHISVKMLLGDLMILTLWLCCSIAIAAMRTVETHTCTIVRKLPEFQIAS